MVKGKFFQVFLAVVTLCAFSCFSCADDGPYMSVEFEDEYTIELVKEYPEKDMAYHIQGLTGSFGNDFGDYLYAGLNDVWDSQVLRIDPTDGSYDVFIDIPGSRDFDCVGEVSPFKEFGNYFYQGHNYPQYSSHIYRIKINKDGTRSWETFVSNIVHPNFVKFPSTWLDGSKEFGIYLYSTRGTGYDEIVKIDPAGNVATFVPAIKQHVWGMTFPPAADYGYGPYLYVSRDKGIYRVDVKGSEKSFCPLSLTCGIEFSNGEDFGKYLYVYIRGTTSTTNKIIRVHPDGVTKEDFILNAYISGPLQGLVFDHINNVLYFTRFVSPGKMGLYKVTKNPEIAKPGVILWNKLGSPDEVATSEIGPSGIIKGKVEYAAGQFNNGIYIDASDFNESVKFPSQQIFDNFDRGCIEMWVKTDYDVIDGMPQTSQPGYSDGEFRIFDVYGNGKGMVCALSLHYGIILHWLNTVDGNVYLYESESDWSAGELVHLAVSWDKDGIADSGDTLGIYVNGVKTAGTAGNLGTTSVSDICEHIYFGNTRDVNQSPGFNAPFRGVIDNVKIWNYAKNDFSDRYGEGHLLLWNKLGSDEEVQNSEVGPNFSIPEGAQLDYDPVQYGDGIFSLSEDTVSKIHVPSDELFSGAGGKDKGCVEFWVKFLTENDTFIGYIVGNQQFTSPYNTTILVGFNPEVYVQYGDSHHLLISKEPPPGWDNPGDIIHVAASWDKDGINGTQDTCRVFIDGQMIMAGQAAVTFNNSAPDFYVLGHCGGHYTSFDDIIIDNIKVWDFAKTDFSDRFTEDGIPPDNTPPVADDISVTTNEDIPVDIVLTATDPEDDDLIYVIVDGPLHGLASLKGDVVAYTPELNYNGADSFTYIANDDEFSSNIATVSLTIDAVNDAPVAGDISIEVNEDMQVDAVLVATDPDGDGLIYAVFDEPSHGSAIVEAHTVIYIPEMNYNGQDSFSYIANDGELDSNSAVVSITIHPVNDIPVAVITGGDRETVVAKIVGFDGSESSDIEDETLSYHWDFGDGVTMEGPIAEHVYTVEGVYTVVLTVTDSEDLSGEASVEVVVKSASEAIDDVIDVIEGFDLPGGTENSFVSKLENAQKSLDKGNDQSAINKIEAFINNVEAQRGKKLTDEQADLLLSAAFDIINAILG